MAEGVTEGEGGVGGAPLTFLGILQELVGLWGGLETQSCPEADTELELLETF